MKKTLVALAVLAASGASFAQVSITGSLIMGYKATTSNSSDASGFGVDTSEINFAATEDLGGGLKATAKLGLAGADRSGESGNGSVGGRDASLTVSGGFGAVVLSASRSADYLTGGLSGVAGIGFDTDYLTATAGSQNKLFSARRIADAIAYVVPVGPVVLTLQHQEDSSGAAPASAAAIAALGANCAGPGTLALGAGAAGNCRQRLDVIGVGYAAGKLAANAQYLSYDNRLKTGAVNANATADYVTRANGSYDLGVAKLGLGFSQANYSDGATIKDVLVGVSVPFGAVTLGAQYGQRQKNDFNASAALAGGNGTTNGTGLNLAYALSKRTSVIGAYSRWDVLNQSTANTEATVLVAHSF